MIKLSECTEIVTLTKSGNITITNCRQTHVTTTADILKYATGPSQAKKAKIVNDFCYRDMATFLSDGDVDEGISKVTSALGSGKSEVREEFELRDFQGNVDIP